MYYTISYESPVRQEIIFVRDANNRRRLSYDTMVDKIQANNFRMDYPSFDIREYEDEPNANGEPIETGKYISVGRLDDEHNIAGNPLYYVGIRPMTPAGLQAIEGKSEFEVMMMRADPAQRELLGDFHVTFDRFIQMAQDHFQMGMANNIMMNGGRRRRRRSKRRGSRRRYRTKGRK